jgi:CDP-diacylglycerol---glycerol-3-phosphate 3-phosphatidyltransferase
MQANGFYGGKGVFGRVPECYTFCEQLFMKNVRAHQRQAESQGISSRTRIELQEWTRDNWTYHAKGIVVIKSKKLNILLTSRIFCQPGLWLSPTASDPPVLTLIGSSNLNSRSAHLDTELSFMMMTSSASVRRTLQEELQGLRKHLQPWQGDQRSVSLAAKLFIYTAGDAFF